MQRCRSFTWFFCIAGFALLLAACRPVARLPAGAQADAGPLPALPATYAPVLDVANFGAPIDNPYFPLQPGTVFVYEGQTDKGMEHGEVTVTDQTRTILGVPTIVVHDVVTVDGKLAEDTFDWYTQDRQGNVWYFGEDAKAYEAGKPVSTTGSWEAGVSGALPGIIMPAQPAVGQAYRQEYDKGNAEDIAQVMSLAEPAATPFGNFPATLLTREWSALDAPPVIEFKQYAQGVGFVMVKEGAGGLKLIEVRRP